MSNIKIEKSTLTGTVAVPSSKSAAHRMIIAASLADGTSVISNVTFSADINATIDCMRSLGANIDADGSTLTVTGISAENRQADELTLDCSESGSTLRFLIPIAAALGRNIKFTGRGKLPTRPIGAYLELLPSHGVSCDSKDGGLPLHISGKLMGGEFPIVGNVSSQYITGLLLALPLLGCDCVIHLTSPLSSVGYVDMTLDIMKKFGIAVTVCGDRYIIKGGQRYKPFSAAVEGDWSQAAFWTVAGLLCGDITVSGVNIDSLQGDREIINIAKHFGGDITCHEDKFTCRKSKLQAYSFDASDIPDIVPIIAVMAAFAEGETVISGTKRLRIKESDRAAAVCDGLKRLGINCGADENSITVCGGRIDSPCEIEGYNDHRIVMSFAVAAAASCGATITDMESINKSYPDFFKDFTKLGGKANVV